MITDIVVKYLDFAGALLTQVNQKPAHQFISPSRCIKRILFDLEFVQVIGNQLFVIYKPVSRSNKERYTPYLNGTYPVLNSYDLE